MTSLPSDTPDEAPEVPDADLVAQLRLDLWAARDAAIAAVASAGAYRARNAELEAEIHRLRVELDRLAHVEHSITYRVGSTALKPAKALRRLAK
ncbi:MAG: hypothetical protein GX868_14295 [Actinobacteria bacterium]|nr:hypothetical protein [Actinomycetota bacterium]